VPAPRPRKISEFKRVLTNLAQTSHYEVKFGAPPSDGALSSYLANRGVDSRFISGDVGLLCYSAELPYGSLATANIAGNYMGIQEKIAHSRIYGQVNLGFYIDSDYKVLKFLEHWAEFIASGSHNPVGTNADAVSQGRKNYFIRMQYPEYYKMESTKIVKFDRDYRKNIEYTFFGMFPSNVGNINVSYDSSRTLTASATFEFTRYVCGPISAIDQKRGVDNNKTGESSLLYASGKVAPLSADEANSIRSSQSYPIYGGEGAATTGSSIDWNQKPDYVAGEIGQYPPGFGP
jgi:hypothetical protein